MINHNGYQRPNYSILWFTPTHRYLCFGHDDINELVSIVEKWYFKRPRHRQKPKIVCNKTGLTVYE